MVTYFSYVCLGGGWFGAYTWSNGSPSQTKPCCMRPQSMSPQWWQYVGLWKVFFRKAWPSAATLHADAWSTAEPAMTTLTTRPLDGALLDYYKTPRRSFLRDLGSVRDRTHGRTTTLQQERCWWRLRRRLHAREHSSLSIQTTRSRRTSLLLLLLVLLLLLLLRLLLPTTSRRCHISSNQFHENHSYAQKHNKTWWKWL